MSSVSYFFPKKLQRRSRVYGKVIFLGKSAEMNQALKGFTIRGNEFTSFPGIVNIKGLMKFIKDVLFVELTTTGADPDKDNILQLAGILLDKDNLLEKSIFNSYVRVSMLDSVIHQHAVILGIPDETLQKSPKIYDTAKKFHEQFGGEPMLATHNLIGLQFLKNGFKKANVPFEYDIHMIDLWTLELIYTLSYGLKKMPTLHTLMDHFRLKIHNPNDALEKVRIEIAVFKKIIGHA